LKSQHSEGRVKRIFRTTPAWATQEDPVSKNLVGQIFETLSSNPSTTHTHTHKFKTRKTKEKSTDSPGILVCSVSRCVTIKLIAAVSEGKT
jgi:hypothetical protein